jgi:hypothetical protein
MNSGTSSNTFSVSCMFSAFSCLLSVSPTLLAQESASPYKDDDPIHLCQWTSSAGDAG